MEHIMGQYVIATFRPKPGQEEALLTLVREHVPILRSLGLATDSPAIILKAAGGDFIEVFEWVSIEAIGAAHSHPEVLKMWERFGKACDYIPLNSIPESSQMFPGFERVEPVGP